MAANATHAGLAGTSDQKSNPWANSGPGRAMMMIATMTSGTPKVAHTTMSTLRCILATSLPIDLPSNFRKEPKVKMKIATAR
jgi:hypothetical protein